MARHVVTFHYTLRDPSGRVLDMSVGGEPISFLEGGGQIIDGLDEKLTGLPAGTKSSVTIAAAKAYGERDDTLVQTVKRAQLPVDGELNVGDQFRTAPDRRAPVVTVAAIEGDDVILDANHPLAGVDLTFDVEIVAVREATEAELSHGHTHDADGEECHEGGGCNCEKSGNCDDEEGGGCNGGQGQHRGR